jgi:hypothetical protein
MKFNLYKSVNDAYIHPDVVVDCDFATIVNILKDSQQLVSKKEDPEMFNLCSWRDDFESPDYKQGYIRRCKANVAQIYALLLDIDRDKTLEDAVNEYSEYEFLIYSTFGNSKQKDKFRLVLPLNTPLTRIEFDQRHDSMCKTFKVDPASFTISQAFYLPSYSRDNADISFIHWNQQPRRYEALFLAVKHISTNIVQGPNEGEVDPYSPIIHETLLTGSNLRYADALPLAVLCKSKGLDYKVYTDIINTIAGVDSSLRTGLADIDNLWNQAYSTYIRRDTMIALMERLNCDMSKMTFKFNAELHQQKYKLYCEEQQRIRGTNNVNAN